MSDESKTSGPLEQNLPYLAEGDPQTPPRARYQVLEREGLRYIACGEVQNIHLYVIRALTVTEGTRKHYPEQTIFLDGTFDGPPFYDNHSRQYSLDHHVGCVRAFMLATCEQAVVMLLQGLPLNEGIWQLYINEPDLDSLLAAWVLMNHVELLSDNALSLRKVMSLVRVEGIIDAHGLDMDILTALPLEIYNAEKRNIDKLREKEKQLKNEGIWDSLDLVDYSREILDALDHLNFSDSFLHQLEDLEEIRHAPLAEQKLAILCRSSQDIYDVEALLKERYERHLALIILDKGRGRFTLRQVDPFLETNLNALYKVLNHKDLWARLGGKAENRWGGSDDIGGSPRSTGSALSGEDILKLAQQIYTKGSGRLQRVLQRVRP